MNDKEKNFGEHLNTFFDYAIKGYVAYEAKEITKKQLDNLYKLAVLFIILFFTYKIIRG